MEVLKEIVLMKLYLEGIFPDFIEFDPFLFVIFSTLVIPANKEVIVV